MNYNVKEVADEFGLEPEELKEVYDAYFAETPAMLKQCTQAYDSGDIQGLARLFHGLKGSSNNLRMVVLGEMAQEGEAFCRGDNVAGIPLLLADFCKMYKQIYQAVEVFYSSGQ